MHIKPGFIIFSILLMYVASFCAGYYKNEIKSDKDIYDLNNKISYYNNKIDSEIKENEKLKNEIEELKNVNKLINPSKQEYIHPISYYENKCIESGYSISSEINCTYAAQKHRENEVEKYSGLLKDIMKPSDYKLLKESQDAFVSLNESNEAVLKKFLYETPGLIHTEIAQSYSKDAVEKRAEFLGAMYYYYYERDLEEKK